jgi:hypothetical protein
MRTFLPFFDTAKHPNVAVERRFALRSARI